MQAFEIVYNSTEERVALGWPGGKVAIHEVASDGSPGDELTQIIHHKATIVCLGYAGSDLVSVSDDGCWAISDPATAEVKNSGSVGGEYVHGSISPNDGALFLFTYVDGDSKAFRVDCESGEQSEGPEVTGELSVTSRVFALSDDVALYHFITDDWDTNTTVEGFVKVDFAAGTCTKQTFTNAPTTDFDSDTRLMAVDAQRGLGIRPDYTPIELALVDGDQRAVLRAEIFDVNTLEVKARPVVLRWPVEHLGHNVEELASTEPGSEEFVEAQDWYVRWMCSARFVANTDHVWVSVRRGIVRRLSLDGAESDAPIIHGGGPSGGGFTLDDVFARNLVNNYTLGVSASGRFVGFGNPNDYFCIDDVDLGAERAVRLPERAQKTATVEAPALISFAGDKLVVFDRAHHMFFASAGSGDPNQTIELPELYGDARCVALSPSGRRLAVAVSGGEAFFYDFEDEELMGLPMPPHSIHAGFTSDARLYLVHHNGAVLAIDFDKQDAKPHRAGDNGYSEDVLEGMDPEEREYMETMSVFEQRYDCYAGTVYQKGDCDWVAVVDENDDLQLYKIGRDDLTFENGPEISVSGYALAASTDWIAAAKGNEISVIDVDAGKVVETLTFDGELRGLRTGSSGALYVFDDRAGQLFRLADPRTAKREVVFTYEGASVAQITISEEAERIALITASGEIELRRLGSGDLVTTLRVEPRGADVRELTRVD